jgi:hypothetical protein
VVDLIAPQMVDGLGILFVILLAIWFGGFEIGQHEIGLTLWLLILAVRFGVIAGFGA